MQSLRSFLFLVLVLFLVRSPVCSCPAGPGLETPTAKTTITGDSSEKPKAGSRIDKGTALRLTFLSLGSLILTSIVLASF